MTHEKYFLDRVEDMLSFIRGHIIADDPRQALQTLKELEQEVFERQQSVLEQLART